MSKFVKLPSQATVDHLELEVAMEQQQLLLVAKFLDKNADLFLDNSVQMFLDSNARMFQDKCPGKNAQHFQDRSARM